MFLWKWILPIPTFTDRKEVSAWLKSLLPANDRWHNNVSAKLWPFLIFPQNQSLLRQFSYIHLIGHKSGNLIYHKGGERVYHSLTSILSFPSLSLYAIFLHLSVTQVSKHPCSYLFLHSTLLKSSGSAGIPVLQMGLKPRQTSLYQMGNT